MERNTNLILVAGFAGVGKSTLARALAWRTQYAYYDKDALTTPLVAALLVALDSPLGREDRETELYATQVRPLEYACLMDAAVACLDLGVSAIVDAPFLREVNDATWRGDLHRRCLGAAAGPVHLHVLWVYCDEATMRRRMVRRDSPRDAAKLGHWEEYCSRCAAVAPPLSPFTAVDSALDEDVERTVDRVLDGLRLS